MGNRGGRMSSILLALLGVVGIAAVVVLRPSAPLPVVETPLVEETPTPGAGGWQPVPILPPPPLRGVVNLTVDQLYEAWGDPGRWEKIQTAETVWITGKLYSLRDLGGGFLGITIMGENEQRNKVEVTGPKREVGGLYWLWETHPVIKDVWVVMKAFEQGVRIGDMLRVETQGPNVLDVSLVGARIENIRIQAR